MSNTKKEIKKIVLAYSGGLDTSVIIPWLKENYPGAEVIAACADVGQPDDFEAIEKKAYASGASKVYVMDIKKEFMEEYVWPTVKAGAVYEGKYLLGTSFARPLISKKLVEVAKKEGAEAIAHGATGKGNDQVRFELTVKALAPEMTLIAPWRMWDLKSREDELAYAEAHNVPIDYKSEENPYPYSMDWNIWHLSHEGMTSKIRPMPRKTWFTWSPRRRNRLRTLRNTLPSILKKGFPSPSMVKNTMPLP